MQKEDQIIAMLEQVLSKQDEHSLKLDEHSRILGEHSQKLDEHSRILGEHTRILGEHSQKLDEHTRILGEHSQQHENHRTQFKEHGDILHALKTGQEYLKAEIDGMKISNAREFGALKEDNNTIFSNLKFLREATWANKVDIDLIKNTVHLN